MSLLCAKRPCHPARQASSGHCPCDTRSCHARSRKRLAAVCLTALAAEKRDRYPSAAALGADVARVVAGQIPAVYREGWLERLRRLAWQYRVPILLVLAYLLMRCRADFLADGLKELAAARNRRVRARGSPGRMVEGRLV